MSPARIILIIDNMGPYHVARLNALSSKLEATCLQVRSKSPIYQWQGQKNANFRYDTLEILYGRLPILFATFHYFLANRDAYEIIFVSGWSTPADLMGIVCGSILKKRVVVMSDSSAHDGVRSIFVEYIKKKILQNVHGAFVAGSRHREYAIDLGISSDCIECNYDVVDNNHFRGEVSVARSGFLAVGRLIEKKNYFFMLDCYTEYHRYSIAIGQEPWPLTIAGYGPLEKNLKDYAKYLGVSVQFLGGKTYDELPGVYASHSVLLHCSTIEQWGLVVNEAMAAGMPVLVSEHCGCVPELVLDGRTGFALPVSDVKPWVDAMLLLSSSEDFRVQIGKTAASHISNYDLQAHARSLMQLVEKVKTKSRIVRVNISSLLIVLLIAIARSFRHGE